MDLKKAGGEQPSLKVPSQDQGGKFMNSIDV